ncbi:MAG: Rne/Rng family ribonuclease [Pseudomonadota bacterium]|nr:Rne/Rng family ribonuclease [Pseudomonadota bacterium]
MSQELFINVTSVEIRAALMDEGRMLDLIVERRERASLVGNIYLGRVERVMTGMEAAFIDLGLPRSGFLGLDGGKRRSGESDVPLHEGETVIVQVVKDAIAGKGVQLSRRLTLPGRFLVYAPLQERVRLSRQIEAGAERDRLTDLMSSLADEEEGFIVRTAAVGASEDELKIDRDQLRITWADIVDEKEGLIPPACLHTDIDPVLRVLRDNALDNIDEIKVDDGAASESARKFCESVMPGMAKLVQLHTGPGQMFEQYGIEEEIERACSRRVELPSGGSLVIEVTEALTSIDVNSGRFEGASNLEQMAYRTNCEAAVEAARQIRLRNASGLIVVDFIQMEDEKNWDDILDLMENVTGKDRNPTQILGVTEAGLVEVTRRRRREPLLHTMTEICAACHGVGRIKSVDAVSIEVLRALSREAKVTPPGEIVLYAAEDVVESLDGEYGELVDAIEYDTGRTIILRSDDEYGRENYDIVVE